MTKFELSLQSTEFETILQDCESLICQIKKRKFYFLKSKIKEIF